MLTKILVPVDGSTLAERALGLAATIAVRAGRLASIDIVHIDTNAAADSESVERIYVNAVAEEVTRLLGVPATGSVLAGDPVAGIVRQANTDGADLIVMTTHGRTGIARAVLGSVADGVVRLSGRPVLLQRPSADRHWRNSIHAGFQRILVPLDGSDEATCVLAPVLELCRAMNARPILVTVVRPVMDPRFSEEGLSLPPVEDDDSTRYLVSQAQDSLTTLARDMESDAQTHVETSVATGTDVAKALIGIARRAKADLIALASSGRGASRMVAGSVGDKLLRGTSLPLLVFHPQRHDDAMGPDAGQWSHRQLIVAGSPQLTP